MGLLRQLFDRGRRRGATIQGVLIFYHDSRWADAAWGRDARGAAMPTELPRGLLEQADRQLNLDGRLLRAMQSSPPRIEPATQLDDAHLRALVRKHYANEHVYFWHRTLSYGTYVLAIIGLRPAVATG